MHRNSVFALVPQVFTHVSDLLNLVKQNSLTRAFKIILKASVAATEWNVKSRMISHSLSVMLFWKRRHQLTFLSHRPLHHSNRMQPVSSSQRSTFLLCLLSPLSIYSMWCYLGALEAFHPNIRIHTKCANTFPVRSLTFPPPSLPPCLWNGSWVR